MWQGYVELFDYMYYNLIPISKINDFLFCPYSLYFHSVYEDFDRGQYKARPQIAGKIAHQSLDRRQFSDRRHFLQNFEVYSRRYGLIGKVDLYDIQAKTLIERKKLIKKIYPGYIYQIYAEKLCLEEMGWSVKKMFLYSKDDRKKYWVQLSFAEKQEFQHILQEIRDFTPEKIYPINKKKCRQCIYREFCRAMDY